MGANVGSKYISHMRHFTFTPISIGLEFSKISDELGRIGFGGVIVRLCMT
jgi:hypothetical protein